MPFKTAEELKLTEKQYCALIKTLVVLEEGRLREDYNIYFDMESWNDAIGEEIHKDYHFCDSVCCIGGTAEVLGKLSAYEFSEATMKNHHLDHLFYPSPRAAWNATEKQAARALRNFLQTGRPSWAMAMQTEA